jgi:hypothetical protein
MGHFGAYFGAPSKSPTYADGILAGGIILGLWYFGNYEYTPSLSDPTATSLADWVSMDNSISPNISE